MGAENCRTAADGVGATDWLEMGGEEAAGGGSLAVADGQCRGCKGVPENGWGDEGAEASLAARARTACVQGGGWKWVGRRRCCG